jgi:hypothetical protein
MHHLREKAEFQAFCIQQGRLQLSTAHQELMDWISKEFEVRALDFSCETKAKSGGDLKQLIHLILETPADLKRIQVDRAAQEMIAARFVQYLNSADAHGTLDPLKRNIFHIDKQPTVALVVTYQPLKKVDAAILKELLDDEKRTILETFESVWTMSQSVIFYYTDAQRQENLHNGISAKISDALLAVERKYALQNNSVFSFDSKESFDRDYESKWHYYWK